MRCFIHCGAVLTLPLLAACGEASSPTTPVAERAKVVAASVSGTPVEAGRSEIAVNMLDACDPATFNAVVGPGTCLRPGGMKFQQFIAELTRQQEVQAWDFAPEEFLARVGQTIVARNLGGEVHTFTRVAEFGGGIIPLLNELSGNTHVAPECTVLGGSAFVPRGGTQTASLDRAGTVHFECCIHPWMRSTVQVQ